MKVRPTKKISLLVPIFPVIALAPRTFVDDDRRVHLGKGQIDGEGPRVVCALRVGLAEKVERPVLDLAGQVPQIDWLLVDLLVGHQVAVEVLLHEQASLPPEKRKKRSYLMKGSIIVFAADNCFISEHISPRGGRELIAKSSPTIYFYLQRIQKATEGSSP